MKILLCLNSGETNSYISNIADAYQTSGHDVVFGVDNFLNSNELPDILHIHWPEAIHGWGSKKFTKNDLNLLEERFSLYKEKNIPIVYTVHDLKPHESISEFDDDICHLIIKFTNIFVHHGNSSIELLKKKFPSIANLTHIVAPYGLYKNKKVSRVDSRKKYKLPQDRVVICNFGWQKKYKNIKFTLTVFDSWKNSKKFLFIIGEKRYFISKRNIVFKILNLLLKFKDDILSKIPNKYKKQIFKLIPEKDIPNVMAASDIIFLGHSSGLNSGLLALAASYGKPVVYPDIGNFREQLDLHGKYDFGFCYEAGNIDSAVEALNSCFEQILTSKDYTDEFLFDNSDWKKGHTWSKHVITILNAVKNIKY